MAALRRLAACAPTARRCSLAVASPLRRTAASLAMPGTPRTLGDVAKLSLLETEEPARISALWDAFHDDKECVAGASLAPDEHASIVDRGAESPMFVFPIRREGGHFMLLSQYATAHRMFALTSLAEYQQNPAMAQPWASLHLFDELLTTKGVGLLRAEVAPERLTTDEAAHLVLLLRRFYGTAQYDKVWMFNHAEKHFDLDAYVAACP